jgi:hypothetical protein
LKICALSESIGPYIGTRTGGSKGAIVRNWLLYVLTAIALFCFGNDQTAYAGSGQTIGKQFPWLMAYVGKTTNELVADHRFKDLTNSIVPNQTVCLFGKPTSLRTSFRKMLTEAPDFVALKDNEFITFAGKDVHHPDDKVIVWLDWRTNNSAFAIVHHYGPDNSKQFRKETMLYVVSSTLGTRTTLPESLKFALKNWLIIENSIPDAIRYNNTEEGAQFIF